MYDLTYENFGMSATFRYPKALDELQPILYPESDEDLEKAKKNSENAQKMQRNPMRPRNMKMHRNPAHPEKLQPKIPKRPQKRRGDKMDENREKESGSVQCSPLCSWRCF